ncbi:MAG: response regulator transcription factor, partial [Chloroflexi bacterium]|nr:response regulator transcription factor [Chloroflexota bacterium]
MQAFLIAADSDEREVLTFVLRHAGLAVSPSGDLARILAHWTELPADLIILAGGAAVEVEAQIAAVRGVTEVPLVVLVDPPAEARLLAMLRGGADVVLARPVSPQLLAEYARVVLRRSGAVPA